MALVAGNTGYWTSGGETLTGTVHSTPLLHSDGTENGDGGEGFYTFTSVTGPNAPTATYVKVRAAEVRSAA